jgi:hypothetical protein
MTDGLPADQNNLEKQFESIYSQTSEVYLPVNLPSEKLYENSTGPMQTTYTIPLTVKITKPKSNPKRINRARVLVGILQSMQNVYADTYLQPKTTDENHSNIYNVDMLKLSEQTLDGYFENAEEVQDGCMLARVTVRSTHPLSEYKKDLKFCKYLSTEQIILEEIRLVSVNPPNLGFLNCLYQKLKTYLYTQSVLESIYRINIHGFNYLQKPSMIPVVEEQELL